MQDLAFKQIKMDVLKNVKKTEQIVDTNASKFVILVKNVNNSHVKLKF